MSQLNGDWVVEVKEPCPHCRGNPRYRQMDGITNPIVTCTNCRGKGFTGHKWLRLHNLLEHLQDFDQSNV
jgi:hypothetical protein